ncbi:MAG: FKBP-type peptidyl-prolyl cis-trans isomerase [Bacteroidota bacterium]
MRNIRYLIPIISGLFLLFITSCSDDFTEHESGLKYIFFKENTNSIKPKQDDVLVLQMYYKTEKDSILFDTREIQGQFRMQMKEPSHNGGCIEDAFELMHVGDSARFLIDAENFYLYTRKIDVPSFIRPGELLSFDIKLVEIFNINDWQGEKNKIHEVNEETEAEFLKSYLSSTSTKTEPLESGLYYIELEKGKGKNPATGDLVEINYLGYFTDGQPFDNSYETGKPYAFRVGINEVIKGMDEGVMLMKEGGKYRLIVPSKLGYGSNEYGPIPPYSTLIFEIELLSVKSYK